MSIRIATREDVPAILEIYRPYVENTAVSFEYVCPSLEAFAARFERYTAQFPWLVWEHKGEILGYAYASAPFERAAFSWCAEPSIYLKREVTGGGIGTRLYDALEAILFYQGYEVLYSLITTENPGSIAFHERRGYRTVGELKDCGIKFSRRVGIVWMEKVTFCDEIPKEMPRPFLELVKSDRNFRSFLLNLSIS